MSKPAISVRNISKCYRLGAIGRHTLVDEVTHCWHRLCGRDPQAHMGRIGHTSTEVRRIEAEKEGQDTFWAIKNVSFDVQPGEVVGIIGRNGAGKSTLLKILSRITEPTEGEAVLKGRVGSLLEVGAGFHPELTGRENIYMNGTILGMKEREIDGKFDEIVAFSEIEKFIDTPVKRYSSGMYVRLAFSVAAHLDPEILIVDEVLAVGDSEFQRKCLGSMKEAATSGRTVLLVSHNMAAIQALCQRAVLMESGGVAVQGAVGDVLARYAHKQGDCRQSMRERTDRRGNGSVRFVGVRLLDSSSREVSVASTGNELCIELEYQASAACIAHLRLGIRNADGQQLFLCFSKASHPGVIRLPPQGRIRCRIPKLPLLPGRYAVDVTCKVNKELADDIPQAFQLNVMEGDYFGTGKLNPVRGGNMVVEHEWAVIGLE